MGLKNLNLIFIGGTGRSGTTILSKILGLHPEIYTFPFEIRFITDPDGLLSLKTALVDHWSFFQADIAVERFIRLMRNLGKRYVGTYPTVGLEGIVGSEFYRRWVSEFVDEIVAFTFKGAWGPRETFWRKVLTKLLGRNRLTLWALEENFYAPPMSEEAFYRLVNKHLHAFFHRAAVQHGKTYCVDATPPNLIHADFLHKICPNLKLIHIYRDPRDVIVSFTHRDWGALRLEQNARWVAEVLDRWETIKPRLPSSTYIEVRFETLVRDTEPTLQKVFDFLGMDFDRSLLHRIDLSKHHMGRWQSEAPEYFRGPWMERYGYLLERYGYA